MSKVFLYKSGDKISVLTKFKDGDRVIYDNRKCIVMGKSIECNSVINVTYRVQFIGTTFIHSLQESALELDKEYYREAKLNELGI
jgi:hypothetical protein